MMRINKKGQTGTVFIVSIFLLFFVVFMWSIMTVPFEKIQDKLGPEINKTVYSSTQESITSAWSNWPILAVIVLIIAVIVVASRERDRRQGF
jgi:NADH:ubiquinone oxidoreductase subunit 6 (subunit J)